MKKTILLLCILLPFCVFSQSFFDDFESYDLGPFDAQWVVNDWQGWLNQNSNTLITDEQINSGTKALKIEEDNNVLALFGNLNSGIYELSFQQFVPFNSGTFINLFHDYHPITEGTKAFEISTFPLGSGRARSNAETAFFDVLINQWVEYKFRLDLVVSEGLFFYNGELISTFPINKTITGALGLNEFNAINFVGECNSTNCNPIIFYDDIVLEEIIPFDFDVEILNPVNPSEYTIVPLGLEKPINLEVDVRNRGTQNLTSLSVTFDVKDDNGNSVFSETTSSISSLASGERITFSGSDNFTISESGNYTVEYQVNLNETDENPIDNLIQKAFAFTSDPSIYARDNGIYLTGLSGEGFFGQNFEFKEQATISGISITYLSGTIGDTIQGSIFSVDSNGQPLDEIATAIPFIINQVATGNSISVTLDFTSNVILNQGEYAFVVEEPKSPISLGLSFDVYTAGKSWKGFPPLNGEIFWLENPAKKPFAIRPLIEEVMVNIDNHSISNVNELKIFPNPTEDFLIIDLSLFNKQNIQIEIFNIQGQLLQHKSDDMSLGNEYKFQIENYERGIYFVKIMIGGKAIVKKVVKV